MFRKGSIASPRNGPGVAGLKLRAVAGYNFYYHSFPYPAALTPQVSRSVVRRTGYAGIVLENMTITGWGDAFGIFYYHFSLWIGT